MPYLTSPNLTIYINGNHYRPIRGFLIHFSLPGIWFLNHKGLDGVKADFKS